MNTSQAKPDARPLYEQARAALFHRIRSGEWAPGAKLPNEFELAAELNISQGTARKAVNELAAEQLVVRKQGRGTFVAEHTPADVLFRFFPIHDEKGERLSPQSRNGVTRRGKATRSECRRLKLRDGARVIRHARVRTADDRPFISEKITLPEKLFRQLGAAEDLPNTLYDMFQRRFGITVGRADERLTVEAAGKVVAKDLAIAPGTPVLRVDRVTWSIDEQPIEWRVSLCHLGKFHYAAQLR